ncbi:hypothetical protein RQP46_009876 [Phenoliferia psychrophenolica]
MSESDLRRGQPALESAKAVVEARILHDRKLRQVQNTFITKMLAERSSAREREAAEDREVAIANAELVLASEWREDWDVAWSRMDIYNADRGLTSGMEGYAERYAAHHATVADGVYEGKMDALSLAAGSRATLAALKTPEDLLPQEQLPAGAIVDAGGGGGAPAAVATAHIPSQQTFQSAAANAGHDDACRGSTLVRSWLDHLEDG